LVEIGDQCWFRENLRAEDFANGEAIPTGDGSAFNAAGSAGTPFVAEHTTASAAAVGLLYNYYAAADAQNICPTGWHVPLDVEFMEMEAFLGMPADELDQDGGYRGYDEQIGPMIRDDVNWDGTNTSGWSGLPGGSIYHSYSPNNTNNAFWWTIGDATSETYAWMRHTYVGGQDIERNDRPKSYALSIRCLKGVSGCTDAGACNYNSEATTDNGTCEYTSCVGCMDNTACNFDPTATINNAAACIAPGSTGASCDDGDPFTFNDVIDETGCTCAGTPMVAADGTGPCAGANTLTYDGHDYTLVEIGTQCWFAENLQADSYRNGATIPYRPIAADWAAMTVGAQVEVNGDAALVADHGRLYNSYAVIDGRGLCPTGWHVPTDANWTTLMDGLGGLSTAGAALKSTANDSPAWNGSNAAGFFGLPSGHRGDDGSYDNFDVRGLWWSSTLSGYNDSYWYYRLSDSDAAERNQNGTPGSGLLVRCLKN